MSRSPGCGATARSSPSTSSGPDRPRSPAIVLVLGASPWLAFVLAGILAGAGALVRPIQNALMPALARSPSELIAANVTSSLGEGAGAFVGPLIGGAIAVGVSPAAGCVVVTLTFLAAAAVLVGLRFADEADARGSGRRV